MWPKVDLNGYSDFVDWEKKNQLQSVEKII